MLFERVSVQYNISKNDVISSVREHCALGLELGLGLAEIRFQQTCF